MKKIVLTGGPCAGKTTALTKLEKEFTELGYQVLVVPEAATLLIQMGIRPFGENALDLLEFQKRVMHLQMTLEEYAEKSCNLEKSIILCDRGVMDDKAYVSEEVFQYLAMYFNQSELDFMNRYDMVLHLKTAADGKEEFYTLDNNSARTETAEEARVLDRKTLAGWLGHRHLKVIGNESTFDEKIRSAIDEVYSLVNLPVPLQRQKKYLVQEMDDEKFKTLDTVSMDIEQYVLKDTQEERIYRKVIKGTSIQYVLLTKVDTNLHGERIVTERSISREEYLQNYPENRVCIQKRRTCFVFDNNYYRLDQFSDGTLLLEADYTKETDSFALPPFILSALDVTENLEYRNSSLYQRMEAANPFPPYSGEIKLGGNIETRLNLDLPELESVTFDRKHLVKDK